MTTSAPQTMVRIPTVLADQMRMIAQAHERSLSAELRVALDAYARQELPKVRRTLKARARR